MNSPEIMVDHATIRGPEAHAVLIDALVALADLAALGALAMSCYLNDHDLEKMKEKYWMRP